jgi:23S rRNA (cytosine1962-C5)-methyltransferase
MASVYVKKGKARPFWFRHPWVFSGAVDHVEGDARDGDVVTVLDIDGAFIGSGIYNSRSQIRVRILSHRPDESIDAGFFRTRLDRAAELRERILDLETQETTGYRLVHGEGDALSGVVIDRYGDHFVIQFSALGIKQREDLFIDYLESRFHPHSIFENANFPYRDAEGLGGESAVRRGELPAGEVEFRESGLRLLADLRHGQKTGYYCDQRDNRRVVARNARGRSVLDAFCYSGGFALHAARAGATEVVAVDSSAAAITLGQRVAELNQLGDRITFQEADVNAYLTDIRGEGKRFDIVVLDPPKFAVAKKDLTNALHRYRELNALAMQAVEPGGLLATSSCSYHVSEPEFEGILNEAAKQTNRFLQVLHRCGQSPDHPVSSACLEGRYLKFVLARVC